MAFCPYCGIKLDGDERICPNCGKNLMDENNVVDYSSQVAETSLQVENEQRSPLQTSYREVSVEKASSGGKKAGVVVLISFFVLLLIGLFIVIFLLRNGTIPKENVNFLPSQLVEWIVPSKKQVISQANLVNRNVFYVVYCFGFVDGRKTLIISSVMEPAFPEKSSTFGAENSFMKMLKIRYAKSYHSLLKTVRAKVYNDKIKALEDREKIKKDFIKDGYKVEVMEVTY